MGVLRHLTAAYFNERPVAIPLQIDKIQKKLFNTSSETYEVKFGCLVKEQNIPFILTQINIF